MATKTSSHIRLCIAQKFQRSKYWSLKINFSKSAQRPSKNCKWILTGIYCDLHSDDGLLPSFVRQSDEPLLVLGPREEVSPLWRFQNRRKHPAPRQQSRDGVDGHVFLATFASHQYRQTHRHTIHEVRIYAKGNEKYTGVNERYQYCSCTSSSERLR